ncbi:MAG: hypothetical protein KG003_00920 [Bacteroidetes bacterium]|nr:hypothetical protein [Bacteroidota bacterium]
MCAQNNYSLNPNSDKNEELKISLFSLYRQICKHNLGIGILVDYLFGPHVKELDEHFTKESFASTVKNIQNLTEKQFLNFQTLLEIFQNTSDFVEAHDICLKRGKTDSYKSVIKKNFSTKTKSKNSRGNKAFFTFLEIRHKQVLKNKKTEFGSTRFERNVTVYAPRGFLKHLCYIIRDWKSAINNINNYFDIIETKYKIELELSNLNIKEIKSQIHDSDAMMKDLSKSTIELHEESIDKIKKDLEQIHLLKSKLKDNSTTVDEFNIHEITRHMYDNAIHYSEFKNFLKKNSIRLLTDVKYTRKQCISLEKELKNTIISDVENTIFNSKNVFD